MGVAKKVQEAGLILGALGVIGFMGIVWLMIYGNLSGNLGFTASTSSFVNETITLDTGVTATPASASNRLNGLMSDVIITNATGGEVVPANNYTVTGVLVLGVTGTLFNNTAVNVSYSLSFASDGERAAEGTISNVTEGFGTFFGFSNTLFTIAAIILLIFMLVGLLAIVMAIAKGSKGSGFTG